MRALDQLVNRWLERPELREEYRRQVETCVQYVEELPLKDEVLSVYKAIKTNFNVALQCLKIAEHRKQGVEKIETSHLKNLTKKVGSGKKLKSEVIGMVVGVLCGYDDPTVMKFLKGLYKSILIKDEGMSKSEKRR